jgi:hypothetical protein
MDYEPGESSRSRHRLRRGRCILLGTAGRTETQTDYAGVYCSTLTTRPQSGFLLQGAIAAGWALFRRMQRKECGQAVGTHYGPTRRQQEGYSPHHRWDDSSDDSWPAGGCWSMGNATAPAGNRQRGLRAGWSRVHRRGADGAAGPPRDYGLGRQEAAKADADYFEAAVLPEAAEADADSA